MFKPVQVKALSNYGLWIQYSDGVEGTVDLKHLVGKGIFGQWNDVRAFEGVYIGRDGQIAWSEAIDLCPDALYLKITGKTPEQVFPNLSPEAVGA